MAKSYKVVVQRTAVSTHTYDIGIDLDLHATSEEQDKAARRIAEFKAKTDDWNGRTQTCTFDALYTLTAKKES